MGGWEPEEKKFRTKSEETVRQAMMEDAARRMKEQMDKPRDDCAYPGGWNAPRGED